MEHSPVATFKWGIPKDRIPLIGPEAAIESALVYDEPFSVYLEDRKCLNSSSLAEILQSPRHYAYAMAGHKELEEEPDYFRFGRAVHLAILEPEKFREAYTIMPEFIGLTKDGKESNRCAEAYAKKDAWLEEHKETLVLEQKELDMLCEMIDTIVEHPIASNMFRNGKPEVTGRFLHPRFPIRCKIRPDYMTMVDEKIYFFDLKSTRSAEERIFANDAARLNYWMKMSFYWDGLKTIFGREPEACALIPIQKSMPSQAEVCWLDEDDLANGRIQADYAIETLLKCVDTNKWPRRKSGGFMLEQPAWKKSEPLPQFEWGESEQQANQGQHSV